jgi:serine/threonine-protein kinase
MPEASPAREDVTIALLFVLAFGILAGSAWLARRNLHDGRGDRAGAVRLAVCMSTVLMLVWLCEVHLVASLGLLAVALVAVCTSVFYGVLLWTIYVALEPSVRKHWPQVLVSWTNALNGHLRDPVVGRDLLIGAALGVFWVLMTRGVDLATGGRAFASFPGATELLTGLRSTLGNMLEGVPYALRNVLLSFFILFVLRLILRNQWTAAIVFAVIFGTLGALGSDEHPALSGVQSFLYFGIGAYAVLRWGLLTYAVGLFVSQLLLNVPATLDTSAWYFGNMLLFVAVPVAIAGWGAYVAVPRRVVSR